MTWRLRLEELASRGDAVALCSRDATMSYATLAERAAEVARDLELLGVRPGDAVAIASSGRAHDEVVGLAGLLGLGATAVPLDATAPAQRLAGIARARGCRAMVLDGAGLAIAEGLRGQGLELPAVVLDAEGRVSGTSGVAVARDGAGVDVAAEDLACVLHTSGSTGTPKPVPITWAGLDAFTAWMIGLVSLAPGDRVLRVAELIFDLSWFDHLGTLRAGATLCTMSRRELTAGRAFAEALAALGPSVIYGVPSLFMKLVAALPTGAPVTPEPRVVFYAGEVFPPRELAAFAQRVPGAELYNLFGPTETNVCTYHRIDRAALDGERETPIGLPCPYAACRLVDEDGGRVIEGAGVGELVVEGPSTMGGGPYATRDRVERGADGLFYFRGRIDRMVKVRGYRVEPGEVEAALGAHPAVRHAAVVVHDDARLGKTLRAFVALRPAEEDASERGLRLFLAERLPPYMVPERVTALEELPLTPTGKVDYRALGDLVVEFGWTAAQRELHQRMRALGVEARAAGTDDRLSVLARGGALGLCLPGDLGGGGLDLVTTAYAYEGLGRELTDGGVLLAAGAHLFGVAAMVAKVGTPEQRAALIPRLASGETLATVAATEVESGSDVATVRCVAERRGDRFVVTGKKRFVTHADRAGLYFVLARDGATGKGLTALLVPRGATGVESGSCAITVGAPLATSGLRGARLAPVSFDGCDVGPEGLLGRAGAGLAVFQIAMTFERALVLAFRLGAMERALEETVLFARTREVGGAPIARHQAVAHRVARMKQRLESSRLLVYRAAWALDQGERGQAEAALAKWNLGEAAVASALDGLRIRGGAGYLEDSGQPAAIDDALGGSLHSGTEDVLATIVARWLGL